MPETQEKNNLTIREVITIGSDPEFAIVSPTDGRTFGANEVFTPDMNPHSPDCDFGYDGHSATGEIRPRPTDSPKKAVEIIKKLFEKNKKKYPQAFKNNLVATSHRLSLGGHIHFGNEKFLSDSNDSLYGDSRLSEIGTNLVVNLDNLLAFPSMYLENKTDAKYRRATGYGSFSDVRTEPWGFEYRTLSSFIASRELTSSIFHLGYAIADATLNFNYHCKELVGGAGFNEAFQNQYRELLKPHLSYVFRQHKILPLYKENKTYRKNIDMFDDMVKKEIPVFDTEIKKGWDIKFDITDFWKVEKLETLLEKVTKLLIAIHTSKQIQLEPIAFRFVRGSFKDIGCPEIANMVNLALNTLINKEVIKSNDWKALRIYGLRESRGNEIRLGNMQVTHKQELQILGYLWEIASEFSHKTKIEDIKFENSVPWYQIAFGRKLREENILIAETMVVVTILLMNRDLFKQSQKVNGKVKKLLVTKRKVIGAVSKHLKNTKKFKAIVPLTKTNKLNSIELPLIFDLNNSWYDIHETIASLDGVSGQEIARICIENFADKSLSSIGSTSCIAHCGTDRPLDLTPLKDLCPKHLAQAIMRLSKLLPCPLSSWNSVFNTGEEVVLCANCEMEIASDDKCPNCENGMNCCCDCYVCSECGERIIEDEFCTECDRCDECCTRCEICGEHEDDDNCRNCNVCDRRNSIGNYCDVCDNCTEHCTCGSTEVTVDGTEGLETTAVNVTGTERSRG